MQVSYEKLRVDENCLFHYQEFKQEEFNSPFHLHDEFELILINKSHGKLYVGNVVCNFSEGDFFFFAPGLPHCFYNSPEDSEKLVLAHAIVIQFKKDFLGKDFFNKTESFKLKKLLDLSVAGIQFLSPSATLKSRILKLNTTNTLQRLANLLIILSELSNHSRYKLLTSSLVAADYVNSRIITDIIQYVAENFRKEITLGEASVVAKMQKSAFCRYFKRKTKKKFTEFVNEFRLIHAQKLLVETDKNILEIAYECGFNSASYFYRIFKKFYEISPLNFRKKTYNKHRPAISVSSIGSF